MENEETSSSNSTKTSDETFSKLKNEYDFFRLLFSDEILDLLVEESNNYYRKILIEKFGTDYKNVILSQNSVNSYPHIYIKKGVTKEDIIAFIGIKIYMGLRRYPTNENYWDNGILYKNCLTSLMSKNYFFFLSKILHFPEKEDNKEDKSSTESDDTYNNIKIDPRSKINLYLEKLAKNFRKYYTLGENITIDESLVHFKGRNSMRFYIPMKPHKYGFKIHLLCDSDTHYLYNMLLDPGNSGKDFIYHQDANSLSESIVLRLISDIKDKKERNIFCDGWYSSISLLKKLSKLGYKHTTVLRANSKDLPPKLKLEGYEKAFSDNILIQKYEGKKKIYFATNYNINMEELRNIYNIKNRGVDTFDQYLEISSSQRRTKKWYKKILIFGIEACIVNSKILFELNTGKTCTTVKYKTNLVEQIFIKYYSHINKGINENKKDISKKLFDIDFSQIQPKKNFKLHNVCKGHGSVKCINCKKHTHYKCVECNISLHPECFTEYHLNHVYKSKNPNEKTK